MARGMVTDHLPERRCIVFSGIVGDFPFDVALDDIPGTCRTVVVKEVVAIDAVLGLVVDGERIHNALLVLRREVEHLLRYLTAPFFIIIQERSGGRDAQFVVCQSKNKP